ncbi:MAG: hypothetical protein ACR2OT_02990 [Parvibaculales bacterium]
MLAILLAACGGGGGSSSTGTGGDNFGNNGNEGYLFPDDVPLDIFENHPINKAILDLTPQAQTDSRYALTANYGDNALFRVGSDGRIWLKASPDYETPDDSDKDGVYHIRVEHSHNAQSYSELEVTVQDVVREVSATEWKNSSNENDYFLYDYEHVKDILPDNDFVKYLLAGNAFALPEEGPVIITWSLVIPASDLSYFEEIGVPKDLGQSTTTQAQINNHRDLLMRAFAEFEQVANVQFIEIEDTATIVGDIRVAISPTVLSQGFSPGDVPPTHINIVTNALYSIYVHEIGHSVGLKHPFEGGFAHNPAFRDRHDLSVMNYGDRRLREMTQNDIDALQFLYGAPGSNFDGLQAKLIDEGITPEVL